MISIENEGISIMGDVSDVILAAVSKHYGRQLDGLTNNIWAYFPGIRQIGEDMYLLTDEAYYGEGNKIIARFRYWCEITMDEDGCRHLESIKSECEIEAHHQAAMAQDILDIASEDCAWDLGEEDDFGKQLLSEMAGIKEDEIEEAARAASKHCSK